MWRRAVPPRGADRSWSARGTRPRSRVAAHGSPAAARCGPVLASDEGRAALGLCHLWSDNQVLRSRPCLTTLSPLDRTIRNRDLQLAFSQLVQQTAGPAVAISGLMTAEPQRTE